MRGFLHFSGAGLTILCLAGAPGCAPSVQSPPAFSPVREIAEMPVSGPDAGAGLPVEMAGTTPLMRAAVSGEEKTLAANLDPASLNAGDALGRTALMHAAIHGHEGIIKRLLREKGLDVNLADNAGHTALMHAAMNGRTGAVVLLLDNGADPRLEDKGRFAAAHLAWRTGQGPLIREVINCFNGYPSPEFWGDFPPGEERARACLPKAQAAENARQEAEREAERVRREAREQEALRDYYRRQGYERARMDYLLRYRDGWGRRGYDWGVGLGWPGYRR